MAAAQIIKLPVKDFTGNFWLSTSACCNAISTSAGYLITVVTGGRQRSLRAAALTLLPRLSEGHLSSARKSM